MADVTEILKKGMSTELWGRRFYQEALEHTESEDGKRIFQSLIEEETRHLEILCGQYASFSKNQACVSMEHAIELAQEVDATEIFPEADAAKNLIPPDASDEQALQMAMDFEQRGYDLYKKAATQAETMHEREMWEYLAAAEDKHFAFLQETHEYLVNDGVWYFDDRELPFFEG
jgi:rubrerythrin